MIICICKNISDDDIRNMFNVGLKTLPDLINNLGVCIDCGICKKDIELLLDCMKEND